MNLLFDTPLPLWYCEIWLTPVSVVQVRGECVCVCVGRILPDNRHVHI